MTAPAAAIQSQSMCAGIEDIDSHYADVVSKRATILTDLLDAPWGARTSHPQ